MPGLDRGDRAQRGRDGRGLVVGRAGNLEGDQGAAPVGGDQAPRWPERGSDVRVAACGSAARAAVNLPGRLPHGRVGGERAGRAPGPGSARPPRPGRRRPAGAGPARPGRTGRRRRTGRLLVPSACPPDEDHGDQGQPAEHGGLAVPGAPPGHPLDERGTDAPAPLVAEWAVAGRTGLRQYWILRLAHHGLSFRGVGAAGRCRGPRPRAATRGRGRSCWVADRADGRKRAARRSCSGPSGPGPASTSLAGASGSAGARSRARATDACARAVSTRT